VLIDIDDFYNRYRVSISNVFDIEGHNSRYRKSRNGISISKFHIFRYRPKILRYRIMISYTISKAFLTFDIEGHYRGRYRIRYSIHPMSFTAERKLPLPRLHHAGAEGSQHHEPWIPAPSSCAMPQLHPRRFDEETSFHRATSTC
jgi:hypothetical protein